MVVRRLNRRIIGIFFASSIVLVVSILGAKDSKKIRQEYTKGYQLLQSRKMSLTYDLIFNHYKDIFSEFPICISELEPILLEYPLFRNHLNNFEDPLSHFGDSVIYFPIYQRMTGIRNGYIVYSSGIDGRFNNSVSKSDTFFATEIYQQFRFYNYLEPACRAITTDTSTNFSLLRYFFGNKDYLISYVICD